MKFPKGFDIELKAQVEHLCKERMSLNEFRFLAGNCKYLSPTYLDWLRNYQFKSDDVKIKQYESGELSVEVIGLWHQKIYWEVPLMAIISELYFKMTDQECDYHYANEATQMKQKALYDLGVNFSDFGTRRRFSRAEHSTVISSFKKFFDEERPINNFAGTSNVRFALDYGLKPIGTMAHEFIMFMAAKYGYGAANKMAMKKWVDVYQGDLGIFLPDTFTTNVFLKSFDGRYARVFDGVRHDSGDPIEFAIKIINHYKSLGIDPKTKTVVFSDGLNVDAVRKIGKFCSGKVKAFYGIGTYFSNDVGVKPLNIVVKMVSADPDGDGNWVNTIKLSDIEGKNTGDPEEIDRCKSVLGI